MEPTIDEEIRVNMNNLLRSIKQLEITHGDRMKPKTIGALMWIEHQLKDIRDRLSELSY